MTNCTKHVAIGSTLPDYARNAHENLALQNRPYGPYRGVDTTKPPVSKLPGKGMMTVSAIAAEVLSPEGIVQEKQLRYMPCSSKSCHRTIDCSSGCKIQRSGRCCPKNERQSEGWWCRCLGCNPNAATRSYI